MLYSTTVVLSSLCFNTPTTTNIYTLSLHDALPISAGAGLTSDELVDVAIAVQYLGADDPQLFKDALKDRKSTRLNSSHRCISYAVFCLKKKKKHEIIEQQVSYTTPVSYNMNNSDIT